MKIKLYINIKSAQTRSRQVDLVSINVADITEIRLARNNSDILSFLIKDRNSRFLPISDLLTIFATLSTNVVNGNVMSNDDSNALLDILNKGAYFISQGLVKVQSMTNPSNSIINISNTNSKVISNDTFSGGNTRTLRYSIKYQGEVIGSNLSMSRVALHIAGNMALKHTLEEIKTLFFDEDIYIRSSKYILSKEEYDDDNLPISDKWRYTLCSKETIDKYIIYVYNNFSNLVKSAQRRIDGNLPKLIRRMHGHGYLVEVEVE